MSNIAIMTTRKHISITDEQGEWVDENNINLSRLVQQAIDDERGVGE